MFLRLVAASSFCAVSRLSIHALNWLIPSNLDFAGVVGVAVGVIATAASFTVGLTGGVGLAVALNSSNLSA